MFYPTHNFAQNITAELAVNPDLSLAVAVVGLLGVYVECCGPGRILPGVLGSAMLILGCWGLSRHPLAWTGICLLGASLVVTWGCSAIPSLQGLGFAGAVLMYRGFAQLLASPPLNPWGALAAAVAIQPITSFLFSTALRARRNKLNDTGGLARLEES